VQTVSSVANLDHNSPHERPKCIGNYHAIKLFVNSSACMCNVTLSRVRATIVAVGKEEVLHIVSMCL
jgi:hypothetical protein